MLVRKGHWGILGGCALAMLGLASEAVAGGTPLTTVQVASGLRRPIYVTAPDGDFNRIFVIEKEGRIRVIENGSLLGTPFLDINALVGGGNSNNDERGLLGLAFHPDFLTNGLFYVNYTNNGSDTTVARYSVDGDPATDNTADAGSASILLTVNQPFTNHNGGWMAFGPDDGYLYISLGDGGSGNDPFNNSQNINTLLGKMLRIDVDSGSPYAIPGDNPFVGVAGDDEIWAYGLRNAWRNSFDTETGELYIADVGQFNIEEVNVQPGSSTGGENYGWRCMEGNSCTGNGGCTCFDAALTDPVHTYTHAFGCSITGGEVYRGCEIPDLQGTYFFADFCSARIWSFRYTGGSVTEFQERTAELAPGGGLSINNITSFGRDAYGEVYICDQGTLSNNGEIFKIVSDAGVVEDCDCNGSADQCDVVDGTLPDDNMDGIPNSCSADADADGATDGCDICPGGDDFIDDDGDGKPNACDACPQDNPDDTDDDGVCESDDICPGGDDNVDTDMDGVPDACDVSAPLAEAHFAGVCIIDSDCEAIGGGDQSVCVPGQDTCYVPKNRMISIDANPENAGQITARRVSLVPTVAGRSPEVLGWVSTAQQSGGSLPSSAPHLLSATPEYADWADLDGGSTHTVHLTDCRIAPGNTYLVQAIAMGQEISNENAYSDPVALHTVSTWGDVVGPLFQMGPNLSSGPNGISNLEDVLVAIFAIEGEETAPPRWFDLEGLTDGEINHIVNLGDALRILSAIETGTYPFPAIGDCP